MLSDEVCIDFVTLFLLVMYYIDIADIQFKSLLKLISENDSCIKQSKRNLQLPLYAPVYIQRTGSKFHPGSKFREISPGSCPRHRDPGPGSCLKVWSPGSCLTSKILSQSPESSVLPQVPGSWILLEGLWSYFSGILLIAGFDLSYFSCFQLR